MRKFAAWTKKIFLVGLTIVLGIKFLSFLLFNIVIDSSYQKYLWRGDWKSKQHSFTSGYIVADMPFSLPVHNTFTGEAFFFRDLCTLRQPFLHDKMNFTAVVFPQSAIGNQTLISDSLSIGFQATFSNNGNKLIEFTGTVDPLRKSIAGAYRIMEPFDMGTFTFTRR